MVWLVINGYNSLYGSQQEALAAMEHRPNGGNSGLQNYTYA